MRWFLAAAWLLSVPLTSCDSAGGRQSSLAVTGFAITSPISPEVDPSVVCGRPTRTSGLITGVPNPYRGRSAYEDDSDVRVLRFINLPDQVRVEIVRAYWYTEGPEPTSAAVSGGLAYVRSRTGETVRVFEKGNASRTLDWDLRDERGGLVPSGFYRVFFTVSEPVARALGYASATVFDDFYIVQHEVSSDLAVGDDEEPFTIGDGSWVDPTGCL